MAINVPVVLNLTWWLSVLCAGHSHSVNVRSSSQRSSSGQKVGETAPGGTARLAKVSYTDGGMGNSTSAKAVQMRSIVAQLCSSWKQIGVKVWIELNYRLTQTDVSGRWLDWLAVGNDRHVAGTSHVRLFNAPAEVVMAHSRGLWPSPIPDWYLHN